MSDLCLLVCPPSLPPSLPPSPPPPLPPSLPPPPPPPQAEQYRMLRGGAKYTPTVKPKVDKKGDENGLLDSGDDTDIEMQHQLQQQEAAQTKFT